MKRERERERERERTALQIYGNREIGQRSKFTYSWWPDTSEFVKVQGDKDSESLVARGHC